MTVVFSILLCSVQYVRDIIYSNGECVCQLITKFDFERDTFYFEGGVCHKTSKFAFDMKVDF